MAQMLKETTRQAILDAARSEFQEKGYENASMRTIAEKAGITVGNIYRYFKDKDDLNAHIISDVSERIEKIFNSLKLNALSKEPRVFNMTTDPIQLEKMMDQLSGLLVELFFEKEEEFKILLNDENLNQKMRGWFENTMRDLISQTYTIPDRKEERDILSHAYARAAFYGLKDIFMNTRKDKTLLLSMTRSYLNNFMKMVNDAYSIRKFY